LNIGSKVKVRLNENIPLFRETYLIRFADVDTLMVVDLEDVENYEHRCPFKVILVQRQNWRFIEEKTYRPFTFREAEKYIGCAVKGMGSGYLSVITGLSICAYVNADRVSYEDLFEHYTFVDGSPCGMGV